jgi:hypothetical protein
MRNELLGGAAVPPSGPDNEEYWLWALRDAPAVPSIRDIDRLTGLVLKNKVYDAAKRGELHLTRIFGRTGATRAEWARWLAKNCRPADAPSPARELSERGIAARTAYRAERAASATT